MHFDSFFFNDTATTEIYTLSLHDALPILGGKENGFPLILKPLDDFAHFHTAQWIDRKSTRLNSSHVEISYAVFCLKKKNALTLMVTVHHNLIFGFSDANSHVSIRRLMFYK